MTGDGHDGGADDVLARYDKADSTPWLGAPPPEVEVEPSPATLEMPGFRVTGGPVWGEAPAGGVTMRGARGTMLEQNLRRGTPVEVVDLAMGFGTSLFGHGAAVAAIPVGAAPGLGDLYAHELRDAACAALCTFAADEAAATGAEPDEDGGPPSWRSLVLHTGSEAVETALKTALLATGRRRILAFEGSYHGTFGLALAVTSRAEFRAAAAPLLAGDAVGFHPYGSVPTIDEDVACVIAEPVQGRAGIIPPPDGWLLELRRACDAAGALLVLDDVLVGCGRSGRLLEGIDARPDVVCLGKALGSGIAASAVLCRAHVAARTSWGLPGTGEPVHTSTTLGDPVASAAVLFTLERLYAAAADGSLAREAAAWRHALATLAARHDLELRGRGLMWALDTGAAGQGFALHEALLARGVLTVPSGADGGSITLLPALVHGDLARDRLATALPAAM